MVAAIIVTYHPEMVVLGALLDSVGSQVDHIIVIDNGSSRRSGELIQQYLPGNGTFISKGYNSGMAEAINTGLSEARKLAASHVVLFDQDSLPDPDMVENLFSVMSIKEETGYRVAAVGPRYSDVKGQQASPFVKLDGIRLRRVDCNEDEIVAVDHLITSGCLISMAALANVGDMEECLFIDYVDTEWCLRALHKGYSLFGVGSARMKHDLGDEIVKLFGRTIPVHSSLRYYYLIRNGIWLLRQPWVSSAWRVMDFRRLFLIYLICSLFVGSKFANWKIMTIGIWDGMAGKMGRYEG